MSIISVGQFRKKYELFVSELIIVQSSKTVRLYTLFL